MAEIRSIYPIPAGSPGPKGDQGLYPQGEYDPALAYRKDTIVNYGDKIWRAKESVLAGNIPAENEFWEVFIDVGPMATPGLDYADQAETRAGDPDTLKPVKPEEAVDLVGYMRPLTTRNGAASRTVDPNVLEITTIGYAAAGDGGGARYKRVVSEPSHAGKFQTADGAWWEIAEKDVTPDMFGAVGDGVADARSSFQAAIDFMSARGGGIVQVDPSKKYLIDGGDLSIKTGVSVVGNFASGGRRGIDQDYMQMNGFIVNPSYTIRMLQNSALTGVAIRRKGLVKPTTYRECMDALALFSGNGVTLGLANQDGGSGADVNVTNCFIIGFNTAIKSVNQERFRFENILGDNINGIYINNCNDTGIVENCHFWPFLNGNSSFTLTNTAITNVVNNGSGLCRVTSAGHPFATGDTAFVAGVGGTIEANSRWAVIKIDANTIDLQGSAFVNAYTSGGLLYASAGFRSGTGFFVDDSDVVVMSDSVAVSYNKGFHIGPTAANTFTLISNCGADYISVLKDPLTIGVHIDAYAVGTRINNVMLGPFGTNVKHDALSGQQTVMTNCAIGNAVVRDVEMNSGRLSIIGAQVQNNAPTRLYIASAAQALSFIGSALGSTISLAAQTDADTQKLVLVGNTRGSDTSQSGVVEASGKEHIFQTISTVSGGLVLRGKIVNSGQLVWGGGSAPFSPRIDTAVITPAIQAIATDASNSVIMTGRFANSANSGGVYLVKSRGTTIGAHGLVQSGDVIGTFRWGASDGAKIIDTAGIRVEATGTPAVDNVAGKMLFSLNVGGATAPRDVFQINNDASYAHPTTSVVLVNALGHLGLRSYTVATLPSASVAAKMIYVSDGTSNKRLAVSDGTNWRFPDGAIVS